MTDPLAAHGLTVPRTPLVAAFLAGELTAFLRREERTGETWSDDRLATDIADAVYDAAGPQAPVDPETLRRFKDLNAPVLPKTRTLDAVAAFLLARGWLRPEPIRLVAQADPAAFPGPAPAETPLTDETRAVLGRLEGEYLGYHLAAGSLFETRLTLAWDRRRGVLLASERCWRHRSGQDNVLLAGTRNLHPSCFGKVLSILHTAGGRRGDLDYAADGRVFLSGRLAWVQVRERGPGGIALMPIARIIRDGACPAGFSGWRTATWEDGTTDDAPVPGTGAGDVRGFGWIAGHGRSPLVRTASSQSSPGQAGQAFNMARAAFAINARPGRPSGPAAVRSARPVPGDRRIHPGDPRTSDEVWPDHS